MFKTIVSLMITELSLTDFFSEDKFLWDTMLMLQWQVPFRSWLYRGQKSFFFSNPACNKFICCQMVSGKRNKKNFRKIFIFRLPKAKKLTLLMLNWTLIGFVNENKNYSIDFIQKFTEGYSGVPIRSAGTYA